MPKFKVIYKYSKKVDFGIVEGKTAKDVEKTAKYKLDHDIITLKTEDDGIPYFKIERVKEKRKKCS